MDYSCVRFREHRRGTCLWIDEHRIAARAAQKGSPGVPPRGRLEAGIGEVEVTAHNRPFVSAHDSALSEGRISAMGLAKFAQGARRRILSG